MRLHISNLNPSLKDDSSDLIKRLNRFGSTTSDLEVRQKPTMETAYGFIDIDLADQQFGQLKKALNNVRYKGHVIGISQARPNFMARWKDDKNRRCRQDHDATRHAAKREIDVIPGRIRKTARSAQKLRGQWCRMIEDGKIVPVKCKQSKLWGYQRDKPLDQLTYVYRNGQWLSGNEDLIETVKFEVDDDKGLFEHEEEKTDERDMHSRLLESLLSGGDVFTVSDEDIPVAEERVDRGGVFVGNYEEPEYVKSVEPKYVTTEPKDNASFVNKSTEEFVDKTAAPSEPVDSEKKKKKRRNRKSRTEMSSDEDSDSDSDDEEEEEEEDKKEDKEEDEKKKEKKGGDGDDSSDSSDSDDDSDDSSDSDDSDSDSDSDSDDSDDEKMEDDVATSEPAPFSNTADTGTLRNLFNPEKEAKFSLFGGDEDEEDEMDVDEILDDKQDEPEQVESQAPRATASTGLFFPHSDSPFLSTQSQIAQLNKKPIDPETWENEFWEDRAEIKDDARSRKRDFQRKTNKDVRK